jgi:hypothetical protein
MGYQLTATARNNALDEITALVDAGSGPGKIRIYSGTAPANADAALSGNTLLAELPLSDPSFPAASSGTLTLDVTPVPEDTSADATGTATFFRILDSDNNPVMQGTVSATGGGGDLQLNTTSIVAAGPVRVTSLTISIAA